jgi:hypothetical protein
MVRDNRRGQVGIKSDEAPAPDESDVYSPPNFHHLPDGFATDGRRALRRRRLDAILHCPRPV